MTLQEFLTLEAITSAAFAEQVGVHHEAVKLWIAGKRYPRRKTMERIVAATDGRVQPNDFLVSR